MVAQDYRPKSRKNDIEGFYASMPPLELMKLIIARAAKSRDKVMLIDVKKAHLDAPIEGSVFVDLPLERAAAGKCARLKYTLYGKRVAAKNWEVEYGGALIAKGFRVGRSNKNTFYHEDRGVRTVVHGDDFVVAGKLDQSKWVEAVMKDKYPIKMRGVLGPDPNDINEAVILNRKVLWKGDAVEFEADSEHVPKMLKMAGLEGCNTTVVPGVKEEPTVDEDLLDGHRGVYTVRSWLVPITWPRTGRTCGTR